MYKLHQTCRACGYAPAPYPGKSAQSSERLIEVFSLGLQPLANDFCDGGDERQGFAPLKVLFCPNCTLAQLSVVVPPSILYSKYNYITSQSKTMQAHFDSLWSDLNMLGPCKKVLEIGSNDGFFLAYCKGNGADHVLGIDPATNLVKVAQERGVNSICSVFDADTARMASTTFPTPDVIVARHVFCHIDDWKGFVHNLAVVAGKDTIIYIEVPYVMDLINGGEFDTIYHEHTSYLSIRALQALLKDSAFYLQAIHRWPIHGGAIGVILRMKPEGEIGMTVDDYLRGESGYTAQRWQDFASLAHAKIAALKSMVETRVANGKRVVGYGASAKSTVWVNACGFTRKHLQFITDNTPQKQWKISPGSDIPIVPEGTLTCDLPDYAVCFAWNYADEIIQKEKIFAREGGRWIVPHPQVEVR